MAAVVLTVIVVRFLRHPDPDPDHTTKSEIRAKFLGYGIIRTIQYRDVPEPPLVQETPQPREVGRSTITEIIEVDDTESDD